MENKTILCTKLSGKKSLLVELMINEMSLLDIEKVEFFLTKEDQIIDQTFVEEIRTNLFHTFSYNKEGVYTVGGTLYLKNGNTESLNHESIDTPVYNKAEEVLPHKVYNQKKAIVKKRFKENEIEVVNFQIHQSDFNVMEVTIDDILNVNEPLLLSFTFLTKGDVISSGVSQLWFPDDPKPARYIMKQMPGNIKVNTLISSYRTGEELKELNDPKLYSFYANPQYSKVTLSQHSSNELICMFEDEISWGAANYQIQYKLVNIDTNKIEQELAKTGLEPITFVCKDNFDGNYQVIATMSIPDVELTKEVESNVIEIQNENTVSEIETKIIEVDDAKFTLELDIQNIENVCHKVYFIDKHILKSIRVIETIENSILVGFDTLYPGKYFVYTEYKDVSGDVRSSLSNILILKGATQTPDLESEQHYLNNNEGFEIQYAWDKGVRGENTVLAVIDETFYPYHEDLYTAKKLYSFGMTFPYMDPDGSEMMSHGASCLGILYAANNGAGVTGIASEAEMTLCMSSTTFEDTIQFLPPGTIISVSQGVGNYPFDKNSNMFNYFQDLLNKGVIVCNSAGNSSINFDEKDYTPSGIILVGACSSDTEHKKMDFSNYGSDVSLCGWGENVTTIIGREDLYSKEGEYNYLQAYTNSFEGTSSAAPLVAGVVSLLQSYAKSEYKYTLTNSEICYILSETGESKKDEGIGVYPKLKSAFAYLDQLFED